MSPRTSDRRGRGTGASPVIVCTGIVSICSLLAGCGQSMRDDHARVRGVVIEAKPGNGNLVATALWTGESFASEARQSRVASANSDTNVASE